MTRPSRADVLLAVIVAVVVVAVSGAVEAHHHQGLGPIGYLLAAAAGVALAWWRMWPTTVLLAVFAVYLADTALGFQPGPVYLPLIIAFMAAVNRGNRRLAHAVLVAGYVVAIGVAGLGGRSSTLAFALGLAAWFLVLAAGAEIIRIRGQARRAQVQEAAQAAETRREHARRRAGEERLRIARDLHDVLAHQLALITVQANVGLALLRRDPARAEQALTAIKAAGNAALGELRSVLDTLRTTELEHAPLRPIPLLSRASDLAGLIESARAAGLVVTRRTDGMIRALPAPVDHTAYRIAQEALTNVVRHAGPGTTVSLRIDYGADRLHLTVEDDGAGTPPTDAPTGGGNGLSGMRERITALCGTLAAAPTPEGGFRVTATLPIRHYAQP